ncbi:MAG TPA: TlpA disulfide reductase family protein [Longimicrobiales bacterium]
MKVPAFFKSKTFDALLLVAALAVLAWRAAPQVEAALGTRKSGAPAPDLHVTTLRGDTLSLAGLRGKVVLVNFWATWCPPCRAEMPGFQKVYEARQGKGLVILGLSTDDDGPVPVAGFLVARGITYPIAMSTIPTEHLFGGINSLPTTFLIDREGRIRYQVQGIFARPALERAVDKLLDE